MGQKTVTLVDSEHPLAFIILGASGDLALRKIYPALFSLYCQGLLSREFYIIGYARSTLSREELLEKIKPNLSCRYVTGEAAERAKQEFFSRCTYLSGQYNSVEDFRRLHEHLRTLQPQGVENRIFYMAIPPFLFVDVARAIREAGLVIQGGNGRNWSRVVIEKPFGSDRASSDELTENLRHVFTEEQTYRIDHYLGKEVIQNLMVLRFANLIFDPIWNRSYIHSVRISWMEDIGLEGRAGYFDQYGIIRDVMQNHLLQMLALVAMEQPIGLDSHWVRDEKVKVLRCIPPLTLENLVVGQYTAGSINGKHHPGYLEEPGVPKGSRTPTFAAAVLHIRNRRWDGVPFLIRAGKGLNSRMTEIRIRFHHVPGNIFANAVGHLANNELIIRVQPDAYIAFRIVNKVPGLRIALDESELDLRYESAFDAVIPEAYESLILDVIRGDRSLFIRADELEAAWDIFTPVLHELEERNIKPRPYPFGGTGPEAADVLASRYGTAW